ncbi:MAG TPA: hypothetical protein VGO50_20450 [Pyrinomonadaceae bacterium]|jgi:hypothetical protein|nr:hypothetical protein [Pyrinomonadaceae bacterium]
MRPYIYIIIGLATYLAAYKLLFKDFTDFRKRGWDMITIWPVVIIIYLLFPRLTDEDYPAEFSWRIAYWLLSGLAIVFIVSSLIY